jgi:pyrroline-5-carboxylate reductase
MNFLTSDGPVWMAGCGNMGGAMLRRWLEAGLDPARVTVIDPAPQSVEGVTWQAEAPATGSPELLVLGIKPQMLDAFAPAIAAKLTKDSVILSMLAGVEVASLADRFPGAGAIVRTMPNLPVELGKGVAGLYAVDPSPALIAAIDALMKPLGLAEWLTEEGHFHAVTALSGSGPAFVYRFIEALGGAGATLGLPADQALRFAAAMVEGAGALAVSSDADPTELARRVTSPGGTTAAGLDVLDGSGVLPTLIRDTLRAAAKRSAELADAAKR